MLRITCRSLYPKQLRKSGGQFLVSLSNMIKQRVWHRKQNPLSRGVASCYHDGAFIELIRFPAAFDHSTESSVMKLHEPFGKCIFLLIPNCNRKSK